MAEKDKIKSRVAAAFSVEADGSVLNNPGIGTSEWAADMAALAFARGGVDDEVLPYIPVGATEAELKEAPASKGMAVLHRKTRFAGMLVHVLENQLVVLSGTESPAERKARVAAGLDAYNEFASEMAGTPINGTAMFMIAYRRPMEDDPHVHEVGFFDAPLWDTFVAYMQNAKESGYRPVKIHWNVLPEDERRAWIVPGPRVTVVATPELLAPGSDFE